MTATLTHLTATSWSPFVRLPRHRYRRCPVPPRPPGAAATALRRRRRPTPAAPAPNVARRLLRCPCIPATSPIPHSSAPKAVTGPSGSPTPHPPFPGHIAQAPNHQHRLPRTRCHSPATCTATVSRHRGLLVNLAYIAPVQCAAHQAQRGAQQRRSEDGRGPRMMGTRGERTSLPMPTDLHPGMGMARRQTGGLVKLSRPDLRRPRRLIMGQEVAGRLKEAPDYGR